MSMMAGGLRELCEGSTDFAGCEADELDTEGRLAKDADVTIGDVEGAFSEGAAGLRVDVEGN
jgi:hypothetical protein